MKIQCNACEAAEAKVLCCADEAALCWECDDKVHAANKLAGKHQRVPLLSASSSSSSSSSRIPKCDICQDASGYFFCLEDRALLCRNCDVAVHTANPCVSAHQRFLLTGIQVGLESTGSCLSVSKEQSAKGASEQSPKLSKSNPSPISYSSEVNEAFSSQVNREGSTGTLRTFFGGASMAGTITDWTLDEFFKFTDFSQNYGFTDNGSSKADSDKFGSSEGSLLSRSFDEDLDAEDCMGQVPEIPSPPTATGLHWLKNSDYVASEFAAFVPDISMQNPPGYQDRTALAKRRRMWHR